MLMGDEGFIEKFKHLLRRYAGRPSLVKLFKGIETKASRDRNIHDAHVNYGYTLKEIADHLKIRYTTVSKAASNREKA